MSGGALDGIRVLEFSQIIAGPVVGISLSDLGADVVKVEQPGGEPLRASGSVVPGESKAFQSYNRGKRGIVLDLHDPRGLQTAYRLIPHMDVVVTNYRPGVVQRLGIDYETLRELREDLIYLEATGFGTTGPEAQQGGNDGVIRAYSGISGGDGQSDEHGAPIIIGATPLADYSTAIAGAMGVCAALFHRERTGQGQYIGASLLRSSIFLQGYTVMREPVTDASVADVIRANIAEARERGAPWTEVVELRKDHFRLRASGRIYYGAYNAKDGPLVLGALTRQTRGIVRNLFDMHDELLRLARLRRRRPQQLGAGRAVAAVHAREAGGEDRGRVDRDLRRGGGADLALLPARGDRRHPPRPRDGDDRGAGAPDHRPTAPRRPTDRDVGDAAGPRSPPRPRRASTRPRCCWSAASAPTRSPNSSRTASSSSLPLGRRLPEQPTLPVSSERK